MTVSERALEILRNRLGELPGHETRGSGWHAFDFALAESSAYSFRIASHTDSQLELRAYPHPDAEGVDLFWHMTLSRDVYPSAEQFLHAISDAVTTVLTKPTRIIQSKTLVGWRFRCEAFTGGKWSKVYAFGCWDTCCHPPKIVGRKATFMAQPLLNAYNNGRSV